ncbi:ATP-binding cassette sub- A member 1 [Nowakowskiella sp. JEL0407]|nr:ATP-binding cassette sub- A member 1 [Nowakowskiella sp. JEL0407]
MLKIRYTKSTIAQTLISPLVFHLLLYILQSGDYARQRTEYLNPPESKLSGIYQCTPTRSIPGCYTIMYTNKTTDSNNFIDSVMRTFSQKNMEKTGIELGFETNLLEDIKIIPKNPRGIVRAISDDFVYEYTLNNPNVTRWGLTFSIVETPRLNIQYQIWVNHSLSSNQTDFFGREVLSLMRGIDESIITVLNPTAPSTNIDISLKDWPKYAPTRVSDNVISSLGPTFFFCTQMVIFIIQLNQIVTEKEKKLREGMQMMGLKPIVYWISSFISGSILTFLNAFITTCLGYIFSYESFTQSHPIILFTLFYFFGLSLLTFGYFLSTFLKNSNTAVLVGIFWFIIGLLFENFVFSNSFVGYLWWESGTIDIAAYYGNVMIQFIGILMFLPFFNFGHMFLDISTRTTGKLDQLTGTYISGKGFGLEDLYTQPDPNLLPSYGGNKPNLPLPIDALKLLIMNLFFYGILTIYFDNVIPTDFGVSSPPWFFLTPAYWGIKISQKKRGGGVEGERQWFNMVCEAWKKVGVKDDEENEEGVEVERKKALNPETKAAVHVLHLRKVYRASIFYKSKNDKIAVKDSCFTLEEGKLLGLLGQNGAGKSTTINILSGLSPTTHGDAMMYGCSVKNEMQEIRKFMGICPQHDILFDDLTAREHIELYAALKGVDKSHVDELIKDRLSTVRLFKVANVRVGTYSGGLVHKF